MHQPLIKTNEIYRRISTEDGIQLCFEYGSLLIYFHSRKNSGRFTRLSKQGLRSKWRTTFLHLHQSFIAVCFSMSKLLPLNTSSRRSIEKVKKVSLFFHRLEVSTRFFNQAPRRLRSSSATSITFRDVKKSSMKLKALYRSRAHR
jgi:hypothetical protein